MWHRFLRFGFSPRRPGPSGSKPRLQQKGRSYGLCRLDKRPVILAPGLHASSGTRTNESFDRPSLRGANRRGRARLPFQGSPVSRKKAMTMPLAGRLLLRLLPSQGAHIHGACSAAELPTPSLLLGPRPACADLGRTPSTDSRANS